MHMHMHIHVHIHIHLHIHTHTHVYIFSKRKKVKTNIRWLLLVACEKACYKKKRLLSMVRFYRCVRPPDREPRSSGWEEAWLPAALAPDGFGQTKGTNV